MSHAESTIDDLVEMIVEKASERNHCTLLVFEILSNIDGKEGGEFVKSFTRSLLRGALSSIKDNKERFEEAMALYTIAVEYSNLPLKSEKEIAWETFTSPILPVARRR